MPDRHQWINQLPEAAGLLEEDPCPSRGPPHGSAPHGGRASCAPTRTRTSGRARHRGREWRACQGTILDGTTGLTLILTAEHPEQRSTMADVLSLIWDSLLVNADGSAAHASLGAVTLCGLSSPYDRASRDHRRPQLARKVHHGSPSPGRRRTADDPQGQHQHRQLPAGPLRQARVADHLPAPGGPPEGAAR
ncbi:hypothetical protein GZL_00145 [Streptomyces sp. 769]|nr:hypothetical protein GZL_00145 [Streptomyces sp. 769]